MPKRDAVFPAKRHALYDAHKYSAAIRSGDLLFVSGQVGSREDGSPEPDYEKQVRLAFANLRAVLAAAGCSFDDVVDVTSFHTDPEAQFETFMSVRAGEIGDPPYPNWTGGVARISGVPRFSPKRESGFGVRLTGALMYIPRPTPESR